MPALNFQKQFADAVESGKKLQTIRAYRKDKRDPKPGDTLYLYTGMRTKQCRKLGEVECKDVKHFALTVRGPSGNVNMTLNCGFAFGSLSGGGQFRSRMTRLARADGFASAEEMVKWFEKTHGLPFEGLLIRWGKD